MTATRLPALACVFAFAAATAAHQAVAAEEVPDRAKTVLAVATTDSLPAARPHAVISASPVPANQTATTAQFEGAAQEDWADPKALMLVFAALFVFLAHRRRSVE